jgi:hypothetical protein
VGSILLTWAPYKVCVYFAIHLDSTQIQILNQKLYLPS